MRVRLAVDIETEDLERLQRYVADQPKILMTTYEDGHKPWSIWGRFVGAKEAYDGTPGSSHDE